MKNSRLSVSVAGNFEELVQAVSIRTAVYVGERGWPFKEEWDGNDFTCTHLLARVDGEPAGTMRIRYFADFAKIERLAVLPHYRQKRYGRMGVAFELGDYGVDFLLRKGFTRIYGHALEELVPFWTKMSRGTLSPMEEGSFECAGKTVIAMFGELPSTPDAITHESGHYMIVRPEGHWDRPGYWESRNQH